MPVNPLSKSCVGDEMRRFQSGALHSGRNGKVVKDKKQALAIALSACGKSKYAESLQSLGYSERVAETVAEMLEYVQIDWGRQFDTGKTAGGVTPPGNIKAPSPSLPGMDIDSRPGIQSGGQGKKKEDSETITALVIWVPSEDEVKEKWKKLSPESVRDPEICFKVLTQAGEEECWSEWEWNYIDTDDGK